MPTVGCRSQGECALQLENRQRSMHSNSLQDNNLASCAPRPVTPLGILSEKLRCFSEAIDAGLGIDRQRMNDLRRATALAAGLDS